jgi:hypothetical protein
MLAFMLALVLSARRPGGLGGMGGRESVGSGSIIPVRLGSAAPPKTHAAGMYTLFVWGAELPTGAGRAAVAGS